MSQYSRLTLLRLCYCASFSQDVGFTLASETDGIAYFHHENETFLLQNFYVKELADNFMMHLLVERVDAWRKRIQEVNIAIASAGKPTDCSTRRLAKVIPVDLAVPGCLPSPIHVLQCIPDGRDYGEGIHHARA